LRKEIVLQQMKSQSIKKHPIWIILLLNILAVYTGRGGGCGRRLGAAHETLKSQDREIDRAAVQTELVKADLPSSDAN
jgi:hypothetical protein